MNAVHLSGYLAADPILRGAEGNVVTIRLGVSTSYRTATGDWAESIAWVTATCFRRQAEQVKEWGLRKGDALIVNGRLETAEWTVQDTGRKASELRVVATEILPSLKPSALKSMAAARAATPSEDEMHAEVAAQMELAAQPPLPPRKPAPARKPRTRKAA